MKCVRLFLKPAVGFWLLGGLFASNNIGATTNAWIGAGADLNWQTAENWTNNVSPTATDDVLFYTNQIVADATINNLVSVDTTIQSLRFMQTNLNSFHNTKLNDGVTLTISNSVSTTNVLFVGTGLAMV